MIRIFGALGKVRFPVERLEIDKTITPASLSWLDVVNMPAIDLTLAIIRVSDNVARAIGTPLGGIHARDWYALLPYGIFGAAPTRKHEQQE
jgi:hypothetical protein